MKTILISGVSQGIGAYMAQHLLHTGHIVIGIGRSKNDTLALDKNFHFYPCDLLESESVNEVSKEIAKKHEVDMFFHNAMYTPKHKPFLRYTDEDMIKAFTVCSASALTIVKNIVSPMRKKKFGRILFTGSLIQHTGSIGQLAYLTAKSSLDGLTKGLALELASSGVTCNLLMLGPVDTEKLKSNLSDEAYENVKASIPTGEFVSQEHLAGMLDFFLTEASTPINGVSLPVGNASHLRTLK
jgi:NAD(P)-dependent dehydrogenase (short-subunit alcohol dehydrogenase family)